MRLQEDYQCYYFVADWHALTTEYENPKAISGFIPEMVTDWLSVGLDPLKSTIFVQSAIRSTVSSTWSSACLPGALAGAQPDL